MTPVEACNDLYKSMVVPAIKSDSFCKDKKPILANLYVGFMVDTKTGKSKKSLREQYQGIVTLINGGYKK